MGGGRLGVGRLVGSSSGTFKSQTSGAAEKVAASFFPSSSCLVSRAPLLYQGKAPWTPICPPPPCPASLHSFCSLVFTLVFVELLVSEKFDIYCYRKFFLFFHVFHVEFRLFILFLLIYTHAPQTDHIHTKRQKPAAAFHEKMRKGQSTGWQLKQRQSVASSSLV